MCDVLEILFRVMDGSEQGPRNERRAQATALDLARASAPVYPPRPCSLVWTTFFWRICSATGFPPLSVFPKPGWITLVWRLREAQKRGGTRVEWQRDLLIDAPRFTCRC